MLIPAFILGIAKEPLTLYIVFAGFQAGLIHSNIRWDLGPLKYVLCSPRYHHWHHSSDDEAIDKNYVAHLPVIDWLFGTFYLPRDRTNLAAPLRHDRHPIAEGHHPPVPLPLPRPSQDDPPRHQPAEARGVKMQDGRPAAGVPARCRRSHFLTAVRLPANQRRQRLDCGVGCGISICRYQRHGVHYGT